MIRPVRDDDFPMLQTLQRFLPEPAPELLEPAAGAYILVSTDDDSDVPVGYLLWLSGEPMYVAELVVGPAFRREGRARGLLTALLESLSPGTRVRLQVGESNAAARSLYDELGFVPVGRDPDAYESEPGLWMERVVG